MPKKKVYVPLFIGHCGGILYINGKGNWTYVTSLLYLGASKYTLFNQKVPVYTGERGGKYGYFPSKEYLKELFVLDVCDSRLVPSN